MKNFLFFSVLISILLILPLDSALGQKDQFYPNNDLILIQEDPTIQTGVNQMIPINSSSTPLQTTPGTLTPLNNYSVNYGSSTNYGSSVNRCSFTHQNANISHLFNYIGCIISTSVIPVIITLAIMMFVWGIVQYVIHPNEEEKRKKGREFMIWGIIALAVMVSVWGLVAILRVTFGIENVIPQLPTR